MTLDESEIRFGSIKIYNSKNILVRACKWKIILSASLCTYQNFLLKESINKTFVLLPSYAAFRVFLISITLERELKEREVKNSQTFSFYFHSYVVISPPKGKTVLSKEPSSTLISYKTCLKVIFFNLNMFHVS